MPCFASMWQLLIKHIFNPETIYLCRTPKVCQTFSHESWIILVLWDGVSKSRTFLLLLLLDIFFSIFFFKLFFSPDFRPRCVEKTRRPGSCGPGYKRRSARAGPVRVSRWVDTWGSASLSRIGLFSSLGAYQIISFKKITQTFKHAVWLVRLLTLKVIGESKSI